MQVNMESEVLLLLDNSGLNKELIDSIIAPHLAEIGIKTLEDLEFLKEDDISSIDECLLNKIEKRKLLKSLQCNLNEAVLTACDAEGDGDADRVISLNYVVYGSFPLVEKTIDDILPSTLTLYDLMQRIMTSIDGLTENETIELYSRDGYPLHNNCITNSVTLQKWVLKENFLFVLVRNNHQPKQNKFATLPALDHEIGEETFLVETPYHGSFQINAYMDSDSPEDIAQKIFSLIDIPVPYMSLFVRHGYDHERLSPFTELQDKDTIRVVLRDPQEVIHPQTTNYGRRSYNPMVSQTDIGISKFYSILKFLCCPQSMTVDYDFEKLLTYLLDLTEFPPLVYSLRVLFEQSHLSVSGWVALFEGCYILFKELISSFGIVPDNQVFELSDYVWSYLIEQSKFVNDVSAIEFDQVSLVCPLSGTRILTPVRIKGIDCGPFDRDNVLEKIKRKENFSNLGFDQTCEILETDLIADQEANDLLLYFPWEHNRQVYKWRNNLKRTQTCKKIIANINSLELPKLLRNLSIVNPSGLFAGSECLTYVDNGQLVFFLGASKGDDEHRRIYNPICEENDYQKLIKKNVLDSFGRSNLEMNVSVDLSSIAAQQFNYMTQSISDQERVNAIIKPHETAQWEPEEAIVVLIDHSGSMSSSIYPELGSMRRIDAAKELFNAFVTRTQAYRLRHCFGLTLFSSTVTVKLPITKNTEEFETSLQDLQPGGVTSLTDAMINGIQQLQRFGSCIRRIICLTDGDNTSHTYSYEVVLGYAKSNDVIIDTVLVTGPMGNEEQKNISHETGGVCVLPLSMNEALSYFEMDTMLSVSERRRPPTHLTGYLMSYHRDYETQDDFQSKAIEEFTVMKTTSAKRFSSSDKSNNCHRRILKEIREIIQNPHPHIKIFPTYESFDSWKVLIKGPPATAYKRGVFVVGVKFPEKYPAVPPEIRFLTRIHHCNISGSSGRVCHAILGNGYTPATSMRDILSHIYGLLMCPDIDTPLDSTLVNDYGYLSNKENAEFYFSVAQNYFDDAEYKVQEYASESFEDLEKKLDDLIK